MRRSTTYIFVLGLALVVTALTGMVFVASAQNSNTSTTMSTNENKPKPTRRGRRHTTKPAATTGDTATEASTNPAPARRHYGRCDPMQQEQTDLSGTYTGKLKHGDEPEMDATLTVTGNKFTAVAGSDNHSGQITAVTTCGYTAVTMMMEGAPTAMSLRAKKVGDNLTLTSVPGEPQKVWFSTGGGAMKHKPRKHKAKPKAEATATPKQ